MENSGNLLKTALVAMAMVLVTASGSSFEKSLACCTKVDAIPITEPVLKYWPQRMDYPCVRAIIFQTENELLCKFAGAPWVQAKVIQLERAKSSSSSSSSSSSLSPSPSTTRSPVSLLSMITSSSSPPSSSSSSSSPPPSSSSSSSSSSSL